jgi:hypothetical protein
MPGSLDGVLPIAGEEAASSAGDSRRGSTFFFILFSMAKTSPTSPAKPVMSIRYGNVSVATFRNAATNKNKKGDQLEHTHSLRSSDLLPAAEALTE